MKSYLYLSEKLLASVFSFVVGSFGKSLELSKKNRAVRVVCVIVVLLGDLMIMNDPFNAW